MALGLGVFALSMVAPELAEANVVCRENQNYAANVSNSDIAGMAFRDLMSNLDIGIKSIGDWFDENWGNMSSRVEHRMLEDGLRDGRISKDQYQDHRNDKPWLEKFDR
jgi:hypothetical protein